jgi:DHA2 family multidrug resistance protein
MLQSLGKLRARIVDSAPALKPGSRHYPWLVLAATSVTAFMAMLDTTIVNVAINKLTVAFGVSTDATEWVITGYMLAFCVMLPTSGWLADRFGYKRIFLLGIALFTAGAFLQGRAWSMGTLIAFRAVQALGGGLIQPLSMAIVTIEFPPRKRALALGFWAIASAASISVGPTLGGYLIDNYSWQSIFDVNVPFGLVGFFAAALIMREHKAESTPAFDTLGLCGITVFLCALILGLSEGNAAWNTDGWASKFILGCFGLSAIGFVVFVVNELAIEDPLVDLRLFADRNFGLSAIILLLFSIGLFGSVFLFPLYLQVGLGYTALQSGIVSLPMGIITAIVAPMAGAISGRSGNKTLLWIGILIMALSFYMNSMLTLFSESVQIIAPVLLRGMGIGLIFSTSTTVAIGRIPTEKMAQASSLTNIIRQIGGSIGIAWFSSSLTRLTKVHLAGLGQGMGLYSGAFQSTAKRLSSFAAGAVGGTASMAGRRAQSLILARAEKFSFVEALSNIFIVGTAIVLATVVPLFFIREPKPAAAEPAAPTGVDP